MRMGGTVSSSANMSKRCWRAMNLKIFRLQLLELDSVMDVVRHILSLREEETRQTLGLLWSW
jgi:hypothetical protein